MLIAPDIAKGDPGDLSAGDSLQIARPTSSTENRHLIAAGSDERDGAFGDNQAVFIRSGLDENLICGVGLV